MGFFSKLKDKLAKTSTVLTEGVKDIIRGGKLDDETCDALEEVLIQADLGVETSLALVEELRSNKFGKDVTDEEIRGFLAEKMAEKLAPCEAPLTLNEKPALLLMVGVNGSGKTTTIGKLCEKYKADGKKVLLAAADTFRAGAVDQLSVWAERTNTEIVKPEKEGADPAGVVYKAFEKAKNKGFDVVIADTAGRLQNRKDLMEQLEKVLRVVKKLDESAPHASVLVLDATVGQNALSQVEAFKETASVTGLVVTKLDSSAKGGVVVALADKFGLPIHFIGVGESVDDLRPFDADAFSKALVDIS